MRRSDIVEILREGRRRRTPRLDICWRDNQLGHARLAVVVPRYGQTVVLRNKLRRRLRERVRRQLLPALTSLDLVIRSREAAYAARVEDCVADLEAWQRSLSG